MREQTGGFIGASLRLVLRWPYAVLPWALLLEGLAVFLRLRPVGVQETDNEGDGRAHLVCRRSMSQRDTSRETETETESKMHNFALRLLVAFV